MFAFVRPARARGEHVPPGAAAVRVSRRAGTAAFVAEPRDRGVRRDLPGWRSAYAGLLSEHVCRRSPAFVARCRRGLGPCWAAWPAVAIAGVSGVFCSVDDLRRHAARASGRVATSVRFFGSCIVLGSVRDADAVRRSRLPGSVRTGTMRAPMLASLSLFVALTGRQAGVGKPPSSGTLLDRQITPLKRSALLMTSRPVERHAEPRSCCGGFGGVVLPVMLAVVLDSVARGAGSLNAVWSSGAAIVAVRRCLAGELLERYLFFAAMRRPRMPGGFVGGSDSRTTCFAREDGPLTEELLLEPAGSAWGSLPVGCCQMPRPRLVCGFCSTGCSLNVHLKDGEAVGSDARRRLSGESRHGLPQGLGSAGRARRARSRDDAAAARRPGQLEPVNWDTALRTFVERMKAIQARARPGVGRLLEHRPDCTEEMALLGALAKFGMGMLHGDGNTRQCMATSVVAYKQAFGFDAPPYTYADFEESDVIVLVGTNLCIAHPILWQRVCGTRIDPRSSSIDPRATETAMAATQHLPLYPKSDLALLYGVARLLIERGWIDREFIAAHTERLRRVRAHVADYHARTCRCRNAARRPSRSSGSPTRFTRASESRSGGRWASTRATRASARRRRSSTGADDRQHRPARHRRQLDHRPVQRDGLAAVQQHDQPARRPRLRERGRIAAKWRDILDIDAERIPDSRAAGRTTGSSKASRGRDPGAVGHRHEPRPFLDQPERRSRRALAARLSGRAGHVPTTETAQLADLVLPAAGWGEKDGTFINSERRIGLVKKSGARAGPGARRLFTSSSWSPKLGAAARCFGAGPARGDFSDPQGALARPALRHHRHRGLRDARPAGRHSMAVGPNAQPVDPETERRLFEDGRYFHQDGKARFLFEAPRPVPEAACRRYPLTLLTGRGSSSQWHTQTRSEKSAVLAGLHPSRVYLEISPPDAQELGIAPDDWVVIESRRGEIRARASVTRTVQPGQVFLPMHYASDEPADFPGIRPVFAAAGVQSLRRQRPPRLQRKLSG